MERIGAQYQINSGRITSPAGPNCSCCHHRVVCTCHREDDGDQSLGVVVTYKFLESKYI